MTDVSVVIPTYNRAGWLRKTVESILQQTHGPCEVIVVDDGSTDDTEAVCAGLPEAVRYIRQTNGGVATARNRGIAEAQGVWVALADSDDLWQPRKLEVQLAALARVQDARWCASNCQVVDEHDQPVSGRQGFERVFGVFKHVNGPPESHFSRWLSRDAVALDDESHTFYHGDFYELLFHGNVILPSSSVIHRDLFEEAGRFDEAFRWAEETEFFHRAASHSPGVLLTTPLVRYRVAGGDSMTNPANTARFASNALVSLDRAAALRGKPTGSVLRAYDEGRQRILAELAYAELSTLDRRGARTALTSAWEAGAKKTPRTMALYAASLLPAPVLRGLHFMKRTLASVRS
jgi:glycosyltransferase involved in cell wall biosynthesis